MTFNVFDFFDTTTSPNFDSFFNFFFTIPLAVAFIIIIPFVLIKLINRS